MTTKSLLEKVQSQKIGKMPVVILPLKDWERFEGIVEEYLMSRSQSYLASVTKARQDIKHGKLYELDMSTGKLHKSRFPL